MTGDASVEWNPVFTQVKPSSVQLRHHDSPKQRGEEGGGARDIDTYEDGPSAAIFWETPRQLQSMTESGVVRHRMGEGNQPAGCGCDAKRLWRRAEKQSAMQKQEGTVASGAKAWLPFLFNNLFSEMKFENQVSGQMCPPHSMSALSLGLNVSERTLVFSVDSVKYTGTPGYVVTGYKCW